LGVHDRNLYHRLAVGLYFSNSFLENRYGKGSVIANRKAFETELAGLPKGPRRSELARKVFDSVRSGFYRRVGQLYKQGLKVLGDRDVPSDTIDKMIRGGTRPAPGTQIDHGIHELAKDPKRALDPTHLGIRKGHAGVPGGSHNEATEGRKKFKIPGGGGGAGGGGGSSGGFTSSTAAELFRRDAQDLQNLYGPAPSAYDTEIDEMEGSLFDIAESLFKGPQAVFKTVVQNFPQLGKASVMVMQSPHMFGARGGLPALMCFNPTRCVETNVDRSEELRKSQAIVQRLNDEAASKAAADPWSLREYYTLDVSVLSTSSGWNYAGPLAARSLFPIYVYH
jgi:hypothetical protein